MKTKRFLLIAFTILIAGVVNAQSFKANAEKTELKWTAKKVTGQHTGHIKLIDGQLTLKDNKIVSSKTITETKAPVAAAIIIGVNADMLTSTNKTSIANSTPAIGALKAAAIPAATPQPISKVLSL